MNKKIIAVGLLSAFTLTSCGLFWGSLPDHLSELKGENSNVVISVNSATVSQDYIDPMFTLFNASTNHYSKKDYDLVKLAYDKYLKWNEMWMSYAVKLDIAKLLAGTNDGSSFDKMWSMAFDIETGNSDIVSLIESFFTWVKKASTGEKLTDTEQKTLTDASAKIAELKKVEAKDSFSEMVTIVEDNAELLGKMAYTEQWSDFEKIKPYFEKIKFNGSRVSWTIDENNSLKGNAVDSNSFNDFSDAVALDDTYWYLAFFNSEEVLWAIQEMMPTSLDGSMVLSSLPSSLRGMAEPFKDKINSILKIVKNLKYAGVVISKDWSKLTMKIDIASTEAKEVDWIKNSLKLLLDTWIEKVKKEMLTQIERSNKSNADTKNADIDASINKTISTLASKMERNGDDIVITLSMDIQNESKFIEFLKKNCFGWRE